MRCFICALADRIDYFLESLYIYKYLCTLWCHARDDNLYISILLIDKTISNNHHPKYKNHLSFG